MPARAVDGRAGTALRRRASRRRDRGGAAPAPDDVPYVLGTEVRTGCAWAERVRADTVFSTMSRP